MTKSDLTAFLALSSKDRLVYLKNLRSIVCGIRIFNKDAGHCGEGIINCKKKIISTLYCFVFL